MPPPGTAILRKTMEPPQGIGRVTSSPSGSGLASFAGQGVSAANAPLLKNAASKAAAASSCFTKTLCRFDAQDPRPAEQGAEPAGDGGDDEEKQELLRRQAADRPVDDLDRGDQAVGQRREGEEDAG